MRTGTRLLAVSITLALVGCIGEADLKVEELRAAVVPSQVPDAVGVPPEPAKVELPEQPTQVLATLTAALTVTVTWSAPSGTEERFEIERSLFQGAGVWRLTTTVPAGTTRLVDTGLAAGTTYLYSVRAVQADRYSQRSNLARVTVTSPSEAPPAKIPPYQFLNADGIGTADQANAYYASISAGGSMTLDDWETAHFAELPRVESFYRNAFELGFWRELACTETIGRGLGGCRVRNWATPADRASDAPNLGTVTMDVSADGFTRFYVFGPDGQLSSSAVLDSEGPKFVPALCTNCHGGSPGSGDMGAIFRELEPALLEVDPASTRAAAEEQWLNLNRAIRSANQALRAQSEGAPAGFDAVKQTVLAYQDSIYTVTDPVVSVDVKDLSHLPDSWKTADPAEFARRSDLWSRLVAPYCMGCHRASSVDLTNYSRFELLAQRNDGIALLQRYVLTNPSDPRRVELPWMPQAELTSKLLRADVAALAAIDAWLAQ